MMMCKRATELMSLRLDRPLSWQENLSLKLHLSLCSACKRCDQQFQLLHHLGDRFPTLSGEEDTKEKHIDGGDEKEEKP